MCAGIGAHIYHSTDGGETMLEITDNVAKSEGVDIGGHTPVPYFVDESALLAFDNGQVAIKGNEDGAVWRHFCRLPGAVLSLCVESRTPSSVIH